MKLISVFQKLVYRASECIRMRQFRKSLGPSTARQVLGFNLNPDIPEINEPQNERKK